MELDFSAVFETIAFIEVLVWLCGGIFLPSEVISHTIPVISALGFHEMHPIALLCRIL